MLYYFSTQSFRISPRIVVMDDDISSNGQNRTFYMCPNVALLNDRNGEYICYQLPQVICASVGRIA